jgi:cytochrome c553
MRPPKSTRIPCKGAIIVTIYKLVKSVVAVVLLTAVAATSALAQGSAEAGLGKVAACAACHGPTGNDSVLPNVPKLGAQGERYLLKQLQEIKADVRKVPLMAGQLANFTEQDLADIAAYYASLDAPQGAVEESKLALGQELYRAGIASLGVAACSACHAPDGKGNALAGYPALSGQDTPYVELQLKAFRAGERSNDEAEVMRTITARLTDAEIAAVASYVAGLR